MEVTLLAAAISFLLAAGLETFFLRGTRRDHLGRMPRAFPTLAVTMVITAGVLGAMGGAEGTSLLFAAAAGMLLLGVGLWSERHGRATRSHALGSVGAALLLFAGGISSPVLTLPGIGTAWIGTPLSFLISVGWVFLMIGLIELCSLLPFVAAAVGMLVGSIVLLPITFHETYAGYALCGMLLGAIPGRFLGELFAFRSRSHTMPEVLVLGLFIGAASLATFVKGFTGMLVVVPVLLATTAAVILVTHSLDSGLILRRKPR
jgi:hypothetical protein